MTADPDNTSTLCNILVAYPYLTKDFVAYLAEVAPKCRILVDSGAFTAWKAGKAIELDDYCRALDSLPFRPWRYFTLDVVGDPEGTLRNYRLMLERGYTPVPIFTRGEDLTVLESFYETSDVVGLGGLVATRGNRGFVNGLMARAGSRRTHWLGFVDANFLGHYRPYMCDSSSWESGARYGQVKCYMGTGRHVVMNRDTFRTRPSDAVIERVRALGVDPRDMAQQAGWSGGFSPIRRLCAASGVSYSLDIHRQLGTLMFNAVTTRIGGRLLVDGFDLLTKGTTP